MTSTQAKTAARREREVEANPLSRPVDLLVLQRDVKPPYDYAYGGDAFLDLTRECSAGILRMTAQATDTNVVGGAVSRDDQFSPVGFYRGAKIGFASLVGRE